jgi:hypothetical protein
MEADLIAQQLQKLIAFSKGEHTNWELLLPLLEADSLRVRVGAYKLLRDRSNYPHREFSGSEKNKSVGVRC